MSIRKDRPKCTNPAMQDLYDRMFPNIPDDEIWEKYLDAKTRIICPLLHSKNPQDKLEGLIQVAKLYTDYFDMTSDEKLACSPAFLFMADDFCDLKVIEPDMWYWGIWRCFTHITKDNIQFILDLLTSVHNKTYIPLDDLSKKRIQMQYKKYVFETWEGRCNKFYYEYFPEDKN